MNTTRSVSEVSHREVPLPLSIRLLRRLEPVVASLLRSPLHRLLSRDVLLLTYRGRRTDRPYTLPLSYVEGDGCLYLCTRPEGSRWWRNLRDGRAVELVLRGRRISAVPRLLDAAADEARAGLHTFVRRNPRTGEMLYGVGRDAQGQPLETDVSREVRRSVVVRLETFPSR